MEELLSFIEEIVHNKMMRAVLSNCSDGAFRRIKVERKQKGFQIIRYTEKQVFHENCDESMLTEKMVDLFCHFKQANFWYESGEAGIRKTKKGKLQFTKSTKTRKFEPTTHNRSKHYLLAEGTIIEPLIDMGIFTQEGKIVRSMQDKYRQINKFIEIIDDALRQDPSQSLNIVDFGCGKSYLTFILYYYLVEVKHVDVKIMGLDLKEEVIHSCNQAAIKYGYQNLHFEVGDIKGYKAPFSVDMVVSLHACDSATDYALLQALQWNARMIFSVPCCQHELNTQIQSDRFAIVSRYGIARERISALYTDIIRCNLLESQNYKVQLLEFVDLTHTPKNMLIRAVKRPIPSVIRKRMLWEVKELITEYHLNPALLRLMKESNLIEEEEL